LEAMLPLELQPYDRAIRVRQKAPVGTVGKSGKTIKYIHVPSTERVVPWQSNALVAKYLYETLGLAKQLHRKTKKVTTDKQALDRLYRQTKNPCLNALRKIRQLDELLSTFLKDDDDDKAVPVGRIHSNFLVHGTGTGRLASSGPNMQNIPSKARYVYVPSHPDWCFVDCDFSSLENRLAAWYANDTDRLARLSVPGFNEHLWLARQIYGEHITKDDPEYKYGKITNHGADGAMGARKLAQTHDLEEKFAKELIFHWRRINHKSAAWQEAAGNAAQKTGETKNAFGRKRWYWSQQGYTEGIRFFPQSTGADICYRSMIGMMYERINWPAELALIASPILFPLPHPARLVLQVHDSLLIECPLNLVEEVAKCLKAVMEQPFKELGGFSIPIEIKTGLPGASWAELTPYKIPQ
jgi:DNA polymerase I